MKKVIIHSLEKGATDMLPLGLEYPSRCNDGQFSFDWRTYLSTVCSELQTADEWAENGLGVSVFMYAKVGP